MTGLGEVVLIGDGDVLAEAVIRVLNDRAKYTLPRSDIEALFSTPCKAELYETVFEELLAKKKGCSVAAEYHESANENAG